MKIAFVFDGLGFGGIEKVGVDYIKLCLQLGYEIDVYNLTPNHNAMVKQLPDGVNYYKRRFSTKCCPELYSYGVQKWWWGKYAYALLSPLVTLAQSVKKVFTKKRKYDISIAFSGHINDLSYVAKKFVRANKKICWCHGNILSYFSICDAYPILYQKIDKFVVLSSSGEKNIYAGHKYMYDKKIFKIYNPTFIHNQKINEDNVNKLKLYFGDFVLMVARLDKNKSQDVAIKAIKLLNERGLNKKIVFVGEGNELNYYQQLVLSLGMDGVCFFVGAKINVCDYIAASYINLLTSKWEGLPTVIIEAMALGKPCIMTNSDDGEVSGNGKYCKLVEVNDAESIAGALYDFYANTEEYDKYCKLSLERAEDFMSDKIQSQLRAVLEK